MSFISNQTSAGSPFQIDLARSIRTSQIICGALITGVLSFLMIVLISANGSKPMPPALTYFGLIFAAVCIVLRFILPGLMTGPQLKNLVGTEAANLDGRLFPLFQTKMIVGAAMLEGAGFFNLICYMTEHQWWSLAVVGFLLLLMAMMFPTLGQYESWSDDAKRDLQSQF